MFTAYNESSFHELNWTSNLESMVKLFYKKNNFQPYHDYPKFQWQEGFDDQLIRTFVQLISTIRYHENQHIHHELKVNKFLFVNKNISKDIVFIGNKN